MKRHPAWHLGAGLLLSASGGCAVTDTATTGIGSLIYMAVALALLALPFVGAYYYSKL